MVEYPNVGQNKLTKHLEVNFKPIPPIAALRIAIHAISIRKLDQTIGLPLFSTVGD